jgi:hypothetical protein
MAITNGTAETNNNKPTKQPVPFWGAPAVLSLIMVSSGVFVWLLAQAIATFSSINY